MPVTFNATKQEINKNGLIQIIKRKVNSDYIKTQLQNYSDCEILDHRIDTLNIIEQSDIEISNNFVMAVHLAYAEHLPLTISPDMIWLLIAQGIARHCSINTEEARKFFVNHDGKKKLVVRRDDFTLHGSNPWHEVFDDFSLQIQTNIGETRSKDLMPVFSTTKELEQTCFHLALMDIMKNYFSYELHTLCDLTEITLEGEKADWVLLLEHVTLLSNYGLDWWVKYLAPALQPFIDAFDGKIDTEYWTEFYKRRGGSGGPFVSGHILKFFPYIEKRRNSYLDSNWGCPVSDIPNGLAVIPMKWIYFDKEFEMSLFSGFLGIGIKEESLRPSIGWAVGTPMVRNLQGWILHCLSKGYQARNRIIEVLSNTKTDYSGWFKNERPKYTKKEIQDAIETMIGQGLISEFRDSYGTYLQSEEVDDYLKE